MLLIFYLVAPVDAVHDAGYDMYGLDGPATGTDGWQGLACVAGVVCYCGYCNQGYYWEHSEEAPTQWLQESNWKKPRPKNRRIQRAKYRYFRDLQPLDVTGSAAKRADDDSNSLVSGARWFVPSEEAAVPKHPRGVSDGAWDEAEVRHSSVHKACPSLSEDKGGDHESAWQNPDGDGP